MHVNSSGYMTEYLPGHPLADARGRVLQHRRIWYEQHGTAPPIVHHRNGDRQDNDPSNLESQTRSTHARMHYPDGLKSQPPWNRGQERWVQRACTLCGATFERLERYV